MKRTYYSNQPQLILNTTGNDSARQPFNIQQPIQQIPPLSSDSCFTLLLTMLFVIATIGGFVYVNMYLTFDLYNVVIDKKDGRAGTAIDNCSQYYCDFSAHYFVHNRASYDKCNQAVCSVLCGGSALVPTFNCTNPPMENIAYYYDCYTYPSCMSEPMYTQKQVPTILTVVFYVASVGGGVFAVGVLISLFYGIVVQCMSKGLSCGQRLALLLNVICPSAKYYAIRSRRDWSDVRINLKGMLWSDIMVTICVAAALGCYIYLAIVRTFLFYEYLVTFGMGLVLLSYSGNLHRNYVELAGLQDRLNMLHQ